MINTTIIDSLIPTSEARCNDFFFLPVPANTSAALQLKGLKMHKASTSFRLDSFETAEYKDASALFAHLGAVDSVLRSYIWTIILKSSLILRALELIVTGRNGGRQL